MSDDSNVRLNHIASDLERIAKDVDQLDPEELAALLTAHAAKLREIAQPTR